ncbi:MAG: hypothetical protein AMXMBFR67_00500 [Nitrospira sp.]|nr:MAG: hypothetical protein DCC63_01805 [Nitrospira sp.]
MLVVHPSPILLSLGGSLNAGAEKIDQQPPPGLNPTEFAPIEYRRRTAPWLLIGASFPQWEHPSLAYDALSAW